MLDALTKKSGCNVSTHEGQTHEDIIFDIVVLLGRDGQVRGCLYFIGRSVLW